VLAHARNRERFARWTAGDCVGTKDFLVTAILVIDLDIIHEWCEHESDGRVTDVALRVASETRNDRLHGQLDVALQLILHFHQDCASRPGLVFRLVLLLVFFEVIPCHLRGKNETLTQHTGGP